jgi:acetolactate synthase-1/2/3 large subunit
MPKMNAFQEADITGATAPFCKHNYLVKKAEELPRIIKEAFHIAATGRPGPVIIDVPVDVQESTIDFKYPESVDIKGYKPTYKGHPMQIRKAAAALEAAKSPVICAGGGVLSANASAELLELAERCKIPVTTTLMGIGALPSNHPLNFGMVGTHGNPAANFVLQHADIVLILGARVGDRAIRATKTLAKKAKIVHIDIDPAEIGKNINVDIPVVGDVRLVLEDILKLVKTCGSTEWNETAEQQKAQHSAALEQGDAAGFVNPKYLLSLLAEYLPPEAVIATEVGQNQIWTANHYAFREPRTFISSGGLGTMGYGLPAAVGAKLGKPGAPVVVISGDGSFQMSMQELGTMKHYGIGVKIILFNNCRLGMVRELQLNKHGGRYSQVCLDKNPDFVALAAAYGFKGERITLNSQIRPALERLSGEEGPYLLECTVNPLEATL